LVEQFYELVTWNASNPEKGINSTPETDPNPRLEAYIEAARRGAAVRILLDGFVSGDYQNPNQETISYLRSVGQAEGLDLEARLANPTHLGLHNKMILADIGDEQYVHVGSINGSEVSSKVNRELALQIRSAQAYDYLESVFEHDWRTATPPIYLPLVTRMYDVPTPVDYVLITEVLYGGTKEQEWVELANPTGASIDLSAYKLGDAERPGDFEGMYRFPEGTTLAPRQILVVAASAAAFQHTYGWDPDLEFYGTDPDVPDMIRFLSWGIGEWALRGAGDEVLLLDALNRPVDVLVYGDGAFPEVIPHPGVSLFTHSLERYPPWFDTDDCTIDFRDWPFPNPGELPGNRASKPPLAQETICLTCGYFPARPTPDPILTQATQKTGS
jgi:hypothetical protein